MVDGYGGRVGKSVILLLIVHHKWFNLFAICSGVSPYSTKFMTTLRVYFRWEERFPRSLRNGNVGLLKAQLQLLAMHETSILFAILIGFFFA